MIELIRENIWLLLFLIWGLPLGVFRSKFRKSVYQTTDWKINIKPIFGKEIKALFFNIYPNNSRYHQIRKTYLVYLIIYFLLFISYLSFKPEPMKEIQIGDNIPLFQLNDQNGNPFVINDYIGKCKMVIFFYPKDDSPGCTKQACSFRDEFEKFNNENTKVIGISKQSVKSHADFYNKYQLNFTLLSDPKNIVRKQFGVPTSFFGLLPGRVTYIVDLNGKIRHIFNSQIQTEKHIQEALNSIKKMP
jgi:peroxiredoxin Q/BCP